ncbi:hypothetical protein [Chitinophaga varians]|uniref:hypothetical protein n=1 Tax=Chitinophaga varians TaxID=2202339 RepID=UPI00165FA723|nr:hypothetical protein [Chitinophaga varians]MBC9912603.1 hypothetical protein [Chitinophaga varians]
MKKLFLAVCALLATAFVYAQKVVLLTSTSRVPEGKKWVVPLKKSLLIEVVPEALRYGNLCSAELLSDNPTVSGLGVGPNPYVPLDIYSIHFTGAKQTSLGVRTLMTVIPTYFGHNQRGYGITSQEENLVMEEGQYVAPMGCLAGIQLLEYTLSPAEIKARKAAAVAAAKAQEKKKQDEEVAWKRKREEETKARLDAGEPFEVYDVSKLVRMIMKDTIDEGAVSRELARLLPAGKEGNYICRLDVDAAGNITSVKSNQLDTAALRLLMVKYFKSDRIGEVTYKDKLYRVPVYRDINIVVVNEVKKIDTYVMTGKKGTFFIPLRAEKPDTTSPYIPYLEAYVKELPEKERKSLNRCLVHTDYVRQRISIYNGNHSEAEDQFFRKTVESIGAVTVDPNVRFRKDIADKIGVGALILGSVL